MPLQFRLVEIVSTVARLGSFSKAAEALFISQPALSQYIQRAEDELGYPLFIRERGSCTPTAAGALLAQRGNFLLNYRDELEHDMAAAAVLHSDTVRVGMANGYIQNYLSPMAKAVYACNPRIHLILIEEYTNKLVGMMRSRDVDIVLMPLPPEVPGIAHQCLRREEMVVVLHPDNPANEAAVTINGIPFIELSALRDVPFILVKDAPRFTDFCDFFFQEAGITPEVIFQPDNWSTCDAMASAGMGVTIVPDIVAKHTKNRNNYYRIKSSYPTFRIMTISYLDSQPLTEDAKQVVAQVQQTFGDDIAGIPLEKLNYPMSVYKDKTAPL